MTKTHETMRSWRPNALSRVASIVQEFSHLEATAGVLLLGCTIIALVWANSSWSASYFSLWETTVSVSFGRAAVAKSVLHWVNDGLMVIFFLVVGLEIKRELLTGELSTLKKASLPVVAALGGMIVPALIYTGFNKGLEGAGGWGIPMATDIAFSLGVLTLLGKRIPLQLKVFLMAFAIADDLGAVVVIALFYATNISWIHLFAAGVILLLLVAVNRAGIRSLVAYIVPGVLLWIAFLDSGIHATVAGVLLAMTIPAFPRQEALHALPHGAAESETPARRLEHALHPWVSYLIVPLFALANSGVRFQADVASVAASPVVVGVFLGLVIGKQIGITVFAWLAVQLRIATLPASVSWRQVYGVAWLGGIGFTMSIFVTNLAFGEGSIADLAKTGIYVASVVAAVGGLWILRRNRILLHGGQNRT